MLFFFVIRDDGACFRELQPLITPLPLTFRLASLPDVIGVVATLAAAMHRQFCLGSSSHLLVHQLRLRRQKLQLKLTWSFRHRSSAVGFFRPALTLGGSGKRVAGSYCLGSRQDHSCDKRGTLINTHSGLMTNVIDSAIDDQNVVLTGILMELE